MDIEKNEMAAATDDNEPVIMRRNVSAWFHIASILSWVVLVFFVVDFIVQI